MYVCMYVCMYVRTYVRSFVHTYVCMYVCMYDYTEIYTTYKFKKDGITKTEKRLQIKKLKTVYWRESVCYCTGLSSAEE